MSIGLIILIIFCVLFAVTYWLYCNKIEKGDVFALKEDENILVYIKRVTKKYVYFEHKKKILCMEKQHFIKNFHKIHFYV